MGENDVQEHTSHFQPPLRRSNSPEEMSEPEEEPDQRWRRRQKEGLPRNEKIRLIILCVGLFALLVGFLLYLFTGTILPLFATMVVVYLGYRRVDAWLDTARPSRH